MRPIGYYVHHHGAGHWRRAAAIARHLRRPCVLIGTPFEQIVAASGIPVVALPDDAPDQRTSRSADAPSFLHYAPIGNEGVRRRSAMVAAWIAEARPSLMVVDVSVEVALLSRLCSTPFLYVRLAGQRDDTPHLAAFGAAEALIAPFPEELEAPGVAPWVLKKTFHAGLLADPLSASQPTEDAIVICYGRGGEAGDSDALCEVARAVPEHRWRVIGMVRPPTSVVPANLELLGWRSDARGILAGASLVVGGAGDGLLAEVAMLGKRFVCLPEARPYAEQREKAERLAELGAAVVRDRWPQPEEWPAVLREAGCLDPARLAALYHPGAVARAAAFIDAAADRVDPRPQ